ncbi:MULTISPECIES: hypothetical protein [unclassified Nitratiruptor]|uniref:hypothetical protein n=1 Tax=unclassified Nitratiruptor TaxID=2624044 RepID=UPI001915FC30|nr:MULTISPECIES: hypothetical protein [unclassified Nitratiruptor]
MAKKKQERIRKRFFADCYNCTASFEAERYEDTQKHCSCGVKLTWNDSHKLKSVEGVR